MNRKDQHITFSCSSYSYSGLIIETTIQNDIILHHVHLDSGHYVWIDEKELFEDSKENYVIKKI